ncbi:MAG: ABC transporter ATP-binding protein [Spirochaetales bacterium]|nr:MAG: ABC transporter ATP-binding protein [Spirochaetales bacterium]
MIEYRGVSKRYGEAWAVHDLDLDIEEGQLVVLIGPSGSGKTTTLRMANRLVEPDSGEVRYAGRPLHSWRPEDLRLGMGYVIQSVGLFPHLSVLENVCTVPRLLGTPRAVAERRADELLHMVGLDPASYRQRRPRQLSGGEAQRVGVARALAADPPVLLMDEPFGAVDPLQRARLQDEFLRIQREIHKTVIFVTHDLDEAVRLADTVVLMRDGRPAQIATPAKLLAEPADDFVRAFVGEDRSLKRLARVDVGGAFRPVSVLRAGERAPEQDASCDGPTHHWVIDGRGKPLGRVKPGDIATPWRTLPTALKPYASLKEALACMLEEGSTVVAVIDDAGVLIGEISLTAIAASSGETGSGGAMELSKTAGTTVPQSIP